VDWPEDADEDDASSLSATETSSLPDLAETVSHQAAEVVGKISEELQGLQTTTAQALATLDPLISQMGGLITAPD
jgi:hypothetical protein